MSEKRQLRILLIDDCLNWQAAVRKTITSYIEPDDVDLRVEATLNGGISSLAEGFIPSLILLDLGLPDAGIERTRNSIKDMNAPVVIVSANVHNPETISTCIKAGAWDVLAKTDVDELRMLLKTTVVHFLRFTYNVAQMK